MDDFLAAAWSAVPAFGLEPEKIDILSRSENVVCDVTLPGGSHLVMRLHRPGYNTLEALNSEVLWVNALRSFGLPVPHAVPTLDGGHYTSVDVDGVERHVGVVEWVNGAPLGAIAASPDDRVNSYRRTGELCAQIRAHGQTWLPPEGFIRRRWDADGFLGEAALWGRFWDVEALRADQRSLFVEARAVLGHELAALPTTRDSFGLIHADLHLGNLMSEGDELTVIDFDDAGFGWFVYDVAVALHPVRHKPWFAEAKASMLAGYRSLHPFSDAEEASIDTFLTMRSLMNVSWLDARPELSSDEYFAATVSDAVVDATKFLQRTPSRDER